MDPLQPLDFTAFFIKCMLKMGSFALTLGSR